MAALTGWRLGPSVTRDNTFVNLCGCDNDNNNNNNNNNNNGLLTMIVEIFLIFSSFVVFFFISVSQLLRLLSFLL